MNATHSRPPCGAQRGFNLIELSIAMAVAVFLLAGMFMMLQNTRKASGNQIALTQLQDSQRFAMTIMTDVIQASGYFPDPVQVSSAGVAGESIYLALPAGTVALPAETFIAGQTIAGVTVAGSDAITVRYVTANSDGIINCTGGTNSTGANQVAVNTFKVIVPPPPAHPYLACSLNGTAPAPASINDIPLVDQVASMQILYGVDTTGARGGGTANTYMTAAQVNLAAMWSNVISVQVKISFVNPLYGQPGQTQPINKTIPFTRVIGVMSKTGVTT